VVSTWGLSQRGRRARFYELTVSGRAAFSQESRNWHTYGAAVAAVMSARPGLAPVPSAERSGTTG
jgi:hypothetical protein